MQLVGQHSSSRNGAERAEDGLSGIDHDSSSCGWQAEESLPLSLGSVPRGGFSVKQMKFKLPALLSLWVAVQHTNRT